MEITLHIEGMTCGGCVKSVEQILTAIQGVQTVAVSLEKQAAEIAFNQEQTSVAALVAAVEDAGFEAHV